jgi:predicted transcriptional regulator
MRRIKTTNVEYMEMIKLSRKIKRLPDAEFEIMKIVWQNNPPVASWQIMESLDAEKKWKPQTVLTMLSRLIEKDFLKSEKIGRERRYTPTVLEKDYLQVETGDFMKRYSGNSVGSLIKAMYSEQTLTQEDIQELKEWLAERI